MPASDWNDLMPDTITYEPATSSNRFGIPTFGAPVQYRARVSYRSIRTRNLFTGDDEVSTATAWVGDAVLTDEGLQYGNPLFGDPQGIGRYPSKDDRITLPNGDQPKILHWEVVSDERGPHHTKILFGGTGFSGSK